MIQILSVDTRATHGLRTFLASAGYRASNQVGSDTRKKSSLRFCSPNSRLRSRSCSASASFWTSCSMNSALATSAYQLAWRTQQNKRLKVACVPPLVRKKLSERRQQLRCSDSR